MSFQKKVGLSVAAFALGFLLARPWSETMRTEPKVQAAGPVSNPKVSAGLSPGARGQAELARALHESLHAKSIKHTGEHLTELCLTPYSTERAEAGEAMVYAHQWALEDPAGMFRWFQARGAKFVLPGYDVHDSYSFVRAVFESWAKSDLAAATDAAKQLVDKSDQSRALGTIVGSLRKSDPQKAAALAQEFANMPGGWSFNFEDLVSTEAKDYEGEWAFLQSLPEGRARGQFMAKFLEETATTHGHKLAALWNNASLELRQEMLWGGFRGGITGEDDEPLKFAGLNEARLALMDSDPAFRAEFASEYISKEGRAWLAKDPEAAVDWCLTHFKGINRVEETAKLFSHITEETFEPVVAAWTRLPDGVLKARALGAMMEKVDETRLSDIRKLIATLRAKEVSEVEVGARLVNFSNDETRLKQVMALPLK